ncbi:MAG: DUF58 domain-containing protein [Candidatus Anammoxibacter sp.]
MNLSELLNPAYLSRFNDLKLLSGIAADGFLTGLHRSLKHGHGMEFFQYRSYTQGDDLKYIDWKIFARRNQLQIKTFEEKSNTFIYLILDNSASMGYKGPESPCSKLEYAIMLSAILLNLAANQGDLTGLAVYNEQIEHWISATNKSEQLHQILIALSNVKPKGKGNHREVWEKLKRKLPGRGIVVFISDMLDAQDELPAILKFAKSARYDCLTIQLLDQSEIDLPKLSGVKFRDMETDVEIAANPHAIHNEYKNKMSDFLDQIKEGLMESGSDFLRISTHEHLGKALRYYLHLREKRN